MITSHACAVFNDMTKALPMARCDYWIHHAHKDEGYYLLNCSSAHSPASFIDNNVSYIERKVDAVADEYIIPHKESKSGLESLRIRTCTSETGKCEVFLIAKLIDRTEGVNLIREVFVFAFPDAGNKWLYNEIKNSIKNYINGQQIVLLQKNRTKWVLLSEPASINNSQCGASIRVTVDEVTDIIDSGSKKSFVSILPSNIIVEFERSYFGWSEGAEGVYILERDKILLANNDGGVLRKNRSKIVDVIEVL